ncbi:Hypothetical predicted protein [Mytilus galloprovincialis]|uniref:Uncharacterized protein n=1 Tax=Mytilus galloprovincialis TaxID=29158 RepID=A0A8B6CVV5_MYTGA|nr:Hypothetical predicted protein [Mytilus galloprovincialis]
MIKDVLLMCFWALNLSFIFVGGNDTVEQTKRLLLNDPDVIGARLTAMDKKISQLQAELFEEKTKNANMRQTVTTIDRYAAGSNYYHTVSKSNFGGPSNTLCLPDDPEISNVTYSGTDSYLYGSEYEHNYFGANSDDEDMPCVVCRMRTAATTLMIPGRKSCYSGWNLEYTGLLASGYQGYSPSTYLCVDGQPEYIPSGQDDKNGHLFYVVGYKCGSLPCPPYHDNRMAYCVVCSK